MIKRILKSKVFLTLAAFVCFILLPIVTTGAIWVQNAGLMEHDAIVFPSNSPAIDRYMASVFKPIYGDRIGICDNVADDVQALAALNAIPAGGGSILFKSGNFTFAATVTRAIDYVTIDGTTGTYFAHDNATPIFSAGAQSRWAFHHFRTDAGGLTYTAATLTTLDDISIGATYYSYLTTEDITASSWNIPTGRTATYVVAASGAPAHVKAQADYVCDGTADNVEIQAAITASPATGSEIQLVGNIFHIAATITMNKHDMTLRGQGKYATELLLDNGVDDSVITILQDIRYPTIKDLNIDGNKTNQSAGDGITTAGIGTIIEECTFDQCYRDSIHVEGSAGHVAPFFIRDVICGNAGRYNLYGYYCHDSWVTNSIFGYSVQHNILINSNDIYMLNNNIYSAGWNGAAYAGDYNNIQIYGLFNRIIGNFINDAARRAISADACENLIISDNNIWNNNQLNDAAIPSIAIGSGGGISSFLVTNNHFIGPNPDYYVSVSVGGFANSGSVTGNWVDGTALWGVYGIDIPSSGRFIVKDNNGAIAPSEVRTASGSLTAGNANAFTFAWQNPELQAIIIVELMVDVTTAGGTAGSVLDAGSAANATTHSSDLITGADLNAIATYVSTARIKVAANGGASDWVTGQILTANAAGLVGKYYITYMGQ